VTYAVVGAHRRSGCGQALTALQAHIAQTVPALWAMAAACRTAPLSDDVAEWDRVDRTGACWQWQGATDLGYGVVKRQGKKQQAHRYAYTLVHGPVPTGLHLMQVAAKLVDDDHIRCRDLLLGDGKLRLR